MERVKNISIIGLGKLGSSMLAAYAARGCSVIGVDVNPRSVKTINEGQSPIAEAHVGDLVARYKQRIEATHSYEHAVAQSDITFIIVPTPTDETGGFTSRYVIDVAQQLGAALKNKQGYHVVVLTSTVMPTHSMQQIIPALERASGKKCGIDFGFCYNPEFIAIGSVVKDLMSPDFILIGEYDARAGDTLERFYEMVLPQSTPVKRMSLVSAEIAKLTLNVYVTMKISFANSLAELCEHYAHANVDDITDAIGTDKRIGKKYLKAGVGFSGPCFPRDNKAFQTLGGKDEDVILHAPITDVINDHAINRLYDAVSKNTSTQGSVAILGVSYKPGTPVVEYSHSITLAEKLMESGFNVTVFDPSGYSHAKEVLGDSVEYASSAQSALDGADAAVLMHPEKRYEQIPFYMKKGSVLVDPWRYFKGLVPTGVKHIMFGIGK